MLEVAVTHLPPRPLALGLLLLTVMSQAIVAGRTCPRDLPGHSNSCLTEYSREHQNLINSQQGLCCGLDVEHLRAFCQAYMAAMGCIRQLKKDCPDSKHPVIERSLTNLHGGQDALNDLCKDDSNIEVYARHQSCFTEAGPSSERCMSRRFNISIKLLANVNTESKDKFCSDMRSVLNCVQNRVKQMCNSEEAVGLAAKLVKPMIRDSTDCVYNTVTKPPDTGQNDRPSVDTQSAQDGSQYNSRTSSGAGPVACERSWPTVALLLLLVIRTVTTCQT